MLLHNLTGKGGISPLLTGKRKDAPSEVELLNLLERLGEGKEVIRGTAPVAQNLLGLLSQRCATCVRYFYCRRVLRCIGNGKIFAYRAGGLADGL